MNIQNPTTLYQAIWVLYQESEYRSLNHNPVSMMQTLAQIEQASILFRILLDLRHQIGFELFLADQ